MHKRTQIIVITSVIVLMGVLLLQPIKGLINPPDETSEQTTSSRNLVNFESESQRAKQGLNPSIIQEIAELEAKLARTSTDEEKLTVLNELASKWDDVNKPAPQGFIYEQIATINQDASAWLKAGNAYRAGYSAIQDTTIAFPLNEYAVNAYQQVLEMEPGNLDAKTGLGAAYVTGSPNPMAGIALLQEVVKEEPEHLEANKTLGLFSMQSRQFDKAIERFLTVIAQRPDAESYFYLATSYENIGLKREAIEAFEKSKQLAADPTLNQFIDRKIEELSK